MPFLASLVLLSVVRAQSEPVKITVHADEPGIAISKSLYGVFFEEINHAGDGGLNPELVRNLNFREPFPKGGTPPGWKIIGDGSGGKVVTGVGGIDVTRTASGDAPVGVENEGYWGMSIEKGDKYRYAVDCLSRIDTPIQINIVTAEGAVCGTAKVTPTSEPGVIKGNITATESSPNARLQLLVQRPGEALITSCSLIPADTWKTHGLRPDLASLVNQLHPAFVRFPGGCYVEGGDYLNDRFQWEKTLGDPGQRFGHRNTTWNYWSTDGLGYHEYLQWCEDMDAEALFVVNCGFSHKQTVPTKELDPYLQSTLDALEYALGPANTPYGGRRAARGHPAPFPLRFLEIGNENGQGWTSGGSPSEYAAHYKLFADAIKSRYPQLTLVADTRAASDAQMVDDHYYNSPTWFWRNDHLYDKTPRTGPNIYVGEYAVTQDCGHGNLRAALAEAAFLTGLERDSDLVKMASYAPLFVNVNNRAWNPDAICFDGSHSYGTPSYYTQALFAANRGDTYLKSDYPELETNEIWTGGIGLGTWNTTAEYKDVSLTADGKPIYESDFAGKAGDWKPVKGNWQTVDGAYRESDQGTDFMSFLNVPGIEVGDCTLKLKARKIGGDEGFLVLFHAKDPNQFVWWNIGGWGNKETGVEAVNKGGKYGIGRHIPFTVESGKWYDIQIEVKGAQMQLFIDGKLVQTVKATGSPSLAVSASKVDANGDLILKIVNGAEVDRDATIQLAGLPDGPFQAQATVLTSASMTDENSLEEPMKISPKYLPLVVAHNSFDFNLKARSITILRLHRN